MLAGARANRHLASWLAAGAAGASVLAIPALAWAGSGGAGMTPSSSAANPGVRPGNVTLTASSGGITLAANASAFVRSGVSVTGSVPAGDAGATVEIDQLGAARGSTWVAVASTRAAANGSFAATWHTHRAGPLTIRAVLPGRQPPSAAASPPTLSLTVYRRSIATLYGPGFYGQRTACGVILRKRTLGVANRTLKCGTEVQIYYRGSVITVPVIDRGPYAHGANWDLTMATGRALGMLGTEVVGAAATGSSNAPSTAAPGAPGTQTAPSAQSAPGAQ